MIEEIIAELDTKGLMVLGVLMGKRYMDILKEEELKVIPKLHKLDTNKLISPLGT